MEGTEIDCLFLWCEVDGGSGLLHLGCDMKDNNGRFDCFVGLKVGMVWILVFGDDMDEFVTRFHSSKALFVNCD